MTPEEFSALAAQGYNRIPVTRQVLADFETPLSAYRKLAQGSYSFLLESVQGGEKWARFSVIGLPCSRVLKVWGQRVEIWEGQELKESHEADDPLAWIESIRQQQKAAELEGLPTFHGGLVGYFAYDAVRFVESRLADSTPEDTMGVPDILLMFSEEVMVFDNLAGAITLVVNVDPGVEGAYDLAMDRLEELAARLPEPVEPLPSINLQPEGVEILLEQAEFDSSQEVFEAGVEAIKEYVLAGDVMQVVPSQRMRLPFTGHSLNLYRGLRNLNPSPYMFYLDLDDFQIVGSSPEILARAEFGQVTVRPLAGTRHRGKTEEEDRALETELLADPKEIAEHLMLIDLGRNDVGRIAEIGSVEVTDQMSVERYSHVMHIVSNVTGTLQEVKSPIDVLRATLPAGTLSGAPKIRAMEIIDELEPVKRGVYGGAVGYISWGGNMDTSIAIRTAVIKDQVLYIQAGAGVVADSVPEREWEETLNKARALFRAAAMACGEG